MVPLHDDNPTRITPYVTYALIAINVVVFFHELSLNSQQLNAFFQLYAVVPEELSASFGGDNINQPVPEWLTLFTSQFLHGGLMHIGGNMLFLWVFGNNIEDRLGHFRYIIFYLLCGALAALAQWFFSMQSGVPSLGASGAIAGVMGAYIIRFPQARILTLVPLGFFITTLRIPAVFFLGFWFVQQALSGVASLGATSDIDAGGIAYWAHAGGFVFGVLLGPLLGLFNDQ
ncbi:MAG: rhomboid family intramembrane serine protease [Cyanophyceae cyanobacterium]